MFDRVLNTPLKAMYNKNYSAHSFSVAKTIAQNTSP